MSPEGKRHGKETPGELGFVKSRTTGRCRHTELWPHVREDTLAYGVLGSTKLAKAKFRLLNKAKVNATKGLPKPRRVGANVRL